MILTPLNVPSIDFNVGAAIYVFGMAGFKAAIWSYVRTPLDEPVTRGIYRVSRNIQEFMTGVSCLGICFLIGSGIAVIVILAAIVFTHFCIIAEEEACLHLYGESYKEYMEKVPRYFVFL